jgi:hypothetical protein
MKKKIYFVPFLLILLLSTSSTFPQGPGEPYHPITANGAKGIWPGHILKWKNPPATIYNKIYFSDNISLVNSMDPSVLIYDGYPSTAYSSVSLGIAGNFDFNKKYYWKVVEYDSTSYTPGPTWYFISRLNPIFPLYENFSSGFNNWEVIGSVGTMNWSVQNSNYAGGSSPELRFSWTPSFNNTSYIMCKTEVDGYNWYSFKHFVDWYTTPFTVGFAVTTNSGSSWTTIWEISPQGNIGPTMVTGLVGGYLEEYKIGFYFSGYSLNIDYWYIDEVEISGPLTPPLPPTYLEAVADTGQLKVYLDWNSGWCVSSQPSSYEIARKEGLPLDTTGYNLLTTISGNILNFTDQTVLSNRIYTYKIRAICGSSPTIWGNQATAYVPDIITSVKDDSDQPEEFYLSQNYPNPFNPSTNIGFRISDFGFVSLKVYDVLGNEVATLVNEEKPAGAYEVEFNIYSGEGRNLSSGVYFYQLKANSFVETKKMILLR